MNFRVGTGSKLKILIVVVLLVAGTLGGATATLAHPGEEDGEKHVAEPQLPDDWEAPDMSGHPGRPQTGNPNSNRPARHAPCVQGVAYVAELDDHPILGTGAFPCDGVDLLSFFTNDEIGGGMTTGSGRGSDAWGWTDPQTGREYVIAGLEVGTSFIDITDPKRPVYLAHLPTSATNNLIWRDIKVHADHAFIVAESSNHGMQVFDLTTLRDLDPDEAPHTVSAAAHYDGFLRAHNIAVNTDTGFAYAVGQRNDAHGCSSSMHMIDISDPTSPAFAGCYDDTGYVHDAHCVVYDGPDGRFTGREICIGANPSVPGVGRAVVVADVSDKGNPVTLGLSGYPNSAYSHQGWFLDGHRYYLHNSESTSRSPQGIDIFDLADLTDPQHIGFFENPSQSTQHNLYQRGRYAFQSNYSSGLRIYDTRDVADGVLEEVGFFDVYPPHDNPGFGAGTWSNYPYFDSGVVAIHGYQGLWIVKPRLG